MPLIFIYRITPAYAGKSIGLLIALTVLRDHPRLCGEKATITRSRLLTMGSPPPMRGKVYSLHSLKVGVRITPAYAGKSNARSFSPAIRRDHPRLCGEKTTRGLFLQVPRGSPPPMRGKGISNLQKEIQRRITPAYAGKSNLVPDFHEIE